MSILAINAFALTIFALGMFTGYAFGAARYSDKLCKAARDFRSDLRMQEIKANAEKKATAETVRDAIAKLEEILEL